MLSLHVLCCPLRWPCHTPPAPLPSCTSQAEQLLSAGRAKYDGGDRMGALRLWEQALGTAPTREQRLAALYNAACVHASFGDLELAQIPLKDGEMRRWAGEAWWSGIVLGRRHGPASASAARDPLEGFWMRSACCRCLVELSCAECCASPAVLYMHLLHPRYNFQHNPPHATPLQPSLAAWTLHRRWLQRTRAM